MGWNNKWIVKYDGNAWTTYSTCNSSLPNDNVRSMMIDGTDIWIGTSGGVTKFDGNNTWTTYDTGNSGIPSDVVRGIAKDGNGDFWLPL